MVGSKNLWQKELSDLATDDPEYADEKALLSETECSWQATNK